MAPGPFNHGDYNQMPFNRNCVKSNPSGLQIANRVRKTPSSVCSPASCSNHYCLYFHEISFDQWHMPKKYLHVAISASHEEKSYYQHAVSTLLEQQNEMKKSARTSAVSRHQTWHMGTYLPLLSSILPK